MVPPGELRVKAGVVCWQVKLCDPHLSALEARFSRRGAIQIDHLYLYRFTFFHKLQSAVTTTTQTVMYVHQYVMPVPMFSNRHCNVRYRDDDIILKVRIQNIADSEED